MNLFCEDALQQASKIVWLKITWNTLKIPASLKQFCSLYGLIQVYYATQGQSKINFHLDNTVAKAHQKMYVRHPAANAYERDFKCQFLNETEFNFL